MQALELSTLQTLAARSGLAVVGVTGTDELSMDREWLRTWQERGFAAEMRYMQRAPELLSQPGGILAGVRSVVTVALFYDRTPLRPLPEGHGRVARYAWGRDYHKVLRRRLEGLVSLVRSELGIDVDARVFSDSVPLLERALAKRAGLGFVGKSSMLIVPGRGTFFFLGEILWNLEVLTDGETRNSRKGHCGSCQSCMERCPTGAFVEERVLDAGRCVSYLSIEKRGTLSIAERRMLGEWVFGCDVCQDVCPFNIVPLKRGLPPDVPELGRDAGIGPSLSLTELLSMRDLKAFERRFAGTALMRAKREGLLRNAAVVAANRHVQSLVPTLLEASREDCSATVRLHALWAYCELLAGQGSASRSRVVARLESALNDPDAEVIAEAREHLGRLPN